VPQEELVVAVEQEYILEVQTELLQTASPAELILAVVVVVAYTVLQTDQDQADLVLLLLDIETFKNYAAV
jgi:hypothetical protein